MAPASPELSAHGCRMAGKFRQWERYASGTPYSVLSVNNALGILPGQISMVEGSQRVVGESGRTIPARLDSHVVCESAHANCNSLLVLSSSFGLLANFCLPVFGPADFFIWPGLFGIG